MAIVIVIVIVSIVSIDLLDRITMCYVESMKTSKKERQ